MADKIAFRSKSGGEASGELALPAGDDKAPAVVLIQEWWGVNDHIRSLLARLTEAGFVALAPDLYHGTVTKDPNEAGRLLAELDKPRALDEIAGAVSYLASHPRSNGKVGVMGFCMGGAFSFAAAATIPELGAAVPFYGVPAPAPDYAEVRAPILAHFAARDGWAKPSDAEAIQRQLQALGKAMELHIYDADHAFVNDTRPEVYAPEAAKLAWDRSIAFLREQLCG
ncbi:MAG TPA: dienelactone hydrolase family protein [Candidatus Nanopelagicales bacterium]|nr:dienelactone hydrolase family protein [Candidatus Nanopelagicales bacterium]